MEPRPITAGSRAPSRAHFELSTPVLDGWKDIVYRHSESILDLDVTSTPAWASVLADVFLGGKWDHTVVLHDNRGIGAVLPLFARTTSVGSVPIRRLSPVTECHCGRCGLMLRDPGIEPLEALMDFVYRGLSGWDLFTITLVGGSESERLFQELLRRRGWSYAQSAPIVSPYAELLGDWDEYFGAIDSKVRSNLRRRERRLRALGDYRLELIQGVRESDGFIAAMLEVERESWKQSAGTAVTNHDCQEQMYRRLVPVAAAKGWLRAYLMRLNDEPIAHLLGLVYNGVFYGLKHSYKDKYQEFSVGSLIQMLVIKSQYERQVRFYDFMGACEPHKMVWARGTYSRSTYTLYNSTPRATLLRYARRLRHPLQRLN